MATSTKFPAIPHVNVTDQNTRLILQAMKERIEKLSSQTVAASATKTTIVQQTTPTSPTPTPTPPFDPDTILVDMSGDVLVDSDFNVLIG